MTRKALGRGLEALIPRATGETAPVISGEKVTIPVDGIRPNPWQPRTTLAWIVLRSPIVVRS